MAKQRDATPVVGPPPSRSLRELYFELGWALLYHNRFPEAGTALERALEEQGSQPCGYDILIQLGSAYERAGDGEAAVRAFLRAAASEPRQVESALPLAAKLITRDIARAVTAWLEGEWLPGIRRAELTASQRLQVALFLGRVGVTAEDQARALAWLKQAATLAGDDAALANEAGAALYEAGAAFLDRNEVASAVEALRLANDRRPDHMPTYWSLVDALRMKSSKPEPPYVSEEEIRESLKVWEQGVARRWPEKGDSWAYLARATVNERLALLPGADRWTLGWEALCYCERALVLTPKDALRYAHLARWYRFLGLAACEDQAAAESLEHDEDDLTALEGRIICLANAGRFEEVAPLLAKRREVDQSTWTDAIEAFVKVRQSEPEAALRLIENAMRDLPNLIWCREVRAECYRKLDRPSDAEKEYRWILDRYNPQDVESQSNWGAAALRLGLREGNIDRALEIFSRIFESRPFPNDPDPSINLGLCWLVKGGLERGRELLAHGIKLCRNRRALDDLLDIELAGVEKASEGWPHGAAVRDVLNHDGDGVKAQIRAQIAEAAGHPLSGAEELRQMLDTRPEGDADGWLRVSGQAGLARLLARDRKLLEAEDLYRQLLNAAPMRFPEARDASIALSDSAEADGEKSFRTRNKITFPY